MYLTKNELQIMDVMWAAKEPISRGELMERSVNKSWKNSSVHILLNSMLKKGVICEAGYKRCGKTVGRIYAPAITVEDYFVELIVTSTTQPDILKLVSAYAMAVGKSDRVINQLQFILSKK